MSAAVFVDSCTHVGVVCPLSLQLPEARWQTGLSALVCACVCTRACVCVDVCPVIRVNK